MIQQEAIVHTLYINRIGEKQFFQVALPKDALRIIGLEYAVRKMDGELIIEASFADDLSEAPYFEKKSNKIIGQLSLQNSSCAGLFFQGDLIDDKNIGLHEHIAAAQFVPKDWIQSTKREEIRFCVSGDVIEGLFKDQYGMGEYEYLEYELSLYFWIEKCEV
jgi:hypothetical protein